MCGILTEQAILRKSKAPRKSPEKWTFLSLAFYNAPSLHTVNFRTFLKTPFSQTLHFMGKLAIFQGKGKAISSKGKLSLRGKIFPLRDNSPNFPSKGKFCLKRCYGIEKPRKSKRALKIQEKKDSPECPFRYTFWGAFLSLTTHTPLIKGVGVHPLN